MEKLKQECIFEDLQVIPLTTQDVPEALSVLSNALFSKGMVKEGFKEAVIKREGIFPTGIPTPTPAAIPHADSEFCLKNAMAVGLAATPIPFGVMGGEEGETIDLKLVFMLSLPNPKSQVPMIQKMVQMLRDDEMMRQLANSDLTVMKNLLESYFQTGCL